MDKLLTIDSEPDDFLAAGPDDPSPPAPSGADQGEGVGNGGGHSGPTPPTALGRLFVEHLRHGLSGRPDRPAPDGGAWPYSDWDGLRASTAGARSPAQAEGRIVLAALRHLAGWVPFGSPFSASPPRAPVPPAPPLGGHGAAAPYPALLPPPALGPPAETARPSAPEGERTQGYRPPPVSPMPAGALPVETVRPRGWERLHRREKLAAAFGWMRNIGVVVILFAAWQVWGTSIAQHEAQRSLGGQFTAKVQARSGPGADSEVHLVSADIRLPQPTEGSLVARLQIPAIGVDEYVVQGTAEGDLAMGPGHYVGTAMPGQAGNVAIAGHRTTYGAPFNDLNSLVPGDPIFLTSDSGTKLEYAVSRPPVAVAPGDVAVLNYFGDNRLTLTTCNPRFSSSQRLVVVALLRSAVGVPASAGSDRHEAAPARLTEGGTVGWNLLYLLPVLAILGAMALLGLANKRSAQYFGRRTRWLVLAPIWVAATYLLFNLLTSLLPATL